MDTLTITHL